MFRLGGVLALLASLGLAGLGALRIQRDSFGGPIEVADDLTCSFRVTDQSVGSLSFVSPYPPLLPPTFPASRIQFRIEGTKGDSVVICVLHLPEEIEGRAVVDGRTDVIHEFLDLPWAGPVAGRTTVRLGTSEWRSSPWALWGWLAGLASAPLLLWGLAALPAHLLRRGKPAAV